MSKKVIFVVTNHEDLGSTGKKTGWYLPEVAHPYYVFTSNGYDVTFVSPKGGKAPLDPGSADAFKDDPQCKEFVNNKDLMEKLNNTLPPSKVIPSDYVALFYAGGHGPMFDLPESKDVADLAASIFKNGGVLGAVCHGTVGLCPIKIDGKNLVEGRTVTSFTNKEEIAVQLDKAMPFMLETKLVELGANFVGKDNFTCNVQVFGDNLVTGQNPASATECGQEMVKLLQKKGK